MQKILNGTNAISGFYNYILLTEYNCNLNFIYGGVTQSDELLNEFETEGDNMQQKTQRALCRELQCLKEQIAEMAL